MAEADVQALNPPSRDRGAHLRPAFVDSPNGQLFTIRHLAEGATRSKLLICPPILHEQIRSYRFFYLLANRLAARGVEVIRFDYAGTGDSEGSSGTASQASMISDIQHLMAMEQAHSVETSVGIMGVRWGAVLASHAMQDVARPPDCAWWWLPVLSGRDYTERLLALDQRTSSSTARYPWSLHPHPRPESELAGFRIPSGFLEDMRALDLVHPDCRVHCAVATGSPVPDNCESIVLPDVVTGWTGEMEHSSMIPIGPATAALSALLAASGMVEQ